MIKAILDNSEGLKLCNKFLCLYVNGILGILGLDNYKQLFPPTYIVWGTFERVGRTKDNALLGGTLLATTY